MSTDDDDQWEEPHAPHPTVMEVYSKVYSDFLPKREWEKPFLFPEAVGEPSSLCAQIASVGFNARMSKNLPWPESQLDAFQYLRRKRMMGGRGAPAIAWLAPGSLVYIHSQPTRFLNGEVAEIVRYHREADYATIRLPQFRSFRELNISVAHLGTMTAPAPEFDLDDLQKLALKSNITCKDGWSEFPSLATAKTKSEICRALATFSDAFDSDLVYFFEDRPEVPFAKLVTFDDLFVRFESEYRWMAFCGREVVYGSLETLQESLTRLQNAIQKDRAQRCEEGAEPLKCVVCHDGARSSTDLQDEVELKCGHVYCGRCGPALIHLQGRAQCVICGGVTPGMHVDWGCGRKSNPNVRYGHAFVDHEKGDYQPCSLVGFYAPPPDASDLLPKNSDAFCHRLLDKSENLGYALPGEKKAVTSNRNEIFRDEWLPRDVPLFPYDRAAPPDKCGQSAGASASGAGASSGATRAGRERKRAEPGQSLQDLLAEKRRREAEARSAWLRGKWWWAFALVRDGLRRTKANEQERKERERVREAAAKAAAERQEREAAAIAARERMHKSGNQKEGDVAQPLIFPAHVSQDELVKGVWKQGKEERTRSNVDNTRKKQVAEMKAKAAREAKAKDDATREDEKHDAWKKREKPQRLNTLGALARIDEKKSSGSVDLSSGFALLPEKETRRVDGDEVSLTSRNTSLITLRQRDHIQQRAADHGITTREMQHTKKHGDVWTRPDGRREYADDDRTVIGAGPRGVEGVTVLPRGKERWERGLRD